MNKILLITLLGISASITSIAQEKKILEVVSENGKINEYKIVWPYKGPPSTGSTATILAKVDTILTVNKIDCPPKREKVSDNIWKCGNGKKIRTKDKSLARLLSKAWD